MRTEQRRKGSYPWSDWFRKKAFTVVRGIDFRGQVHGMASCIRNAAVRWGVRVSLDVEGDRITVLVNPGPGVDGRKR